MLSISEEEFLNKVGDLPSVFEKTEIQIIKQHIESWKKQCGYDIPFDYEGLNIHLNNNKRELGQMIEHAHEHGNDHDDREEMLRLFKTL